MTRASVADRITAGLPASWTDFSRHVGVLKRLHQPQRLVDRAADRKVVDRDLTQHALVIDDEQTPEQKQQPWQIRESRDGPVVSMQVSQSEVSGFKSRSGQIAYFHDVKTRLSTFGTGDVPRGSDST